MIGTQVSVIGELRGLRTSGSTPIALVKMWSRKGLGAAQVCHHFAVVSDRLHRTAMSTLGRKRTFIRDEIIPKTTAMYLIVLGVFQGVVLGINLLTD